MTLLDNSNYWEEAFQVWYMTNQPKGAKEIQEVIPVMPDGEKPSLGVIRSAVESYGWIERADGLNAEASRKNDIVLVEHKAEMLRRQAEDAARIADKAKEHILGEGFDTSASAVNAYFKATEEERIVRGVSEMLVKISKMSPEELIARAEKLAKQKSEAVDGDIVEEEDASSDTSTTE